MQTFVLQVRSGDGVSPHPGEGVLDTYACDRLSCVQIFRQDPGGATLQSGRHNERFPESDLGCILDLKCSRNLNCCGVDAPYRVVAHNQAGGRFGDRTRNLPRDIDVELLEHLRAENASPLVPKLA